MKVCVLTLGCKVNTYESAVIKDLFIQNNDVIVDIKDNPDVIIINSCTVTNGADAKSRKMIRSAKKNNPKAILIVCGCFSQHYQEELLHFDIDILIGNKDKTKLVAILKDYLKNKKRYYKFYDLNNSAFEDMIIKEFSGRTRAFVKLQDGCNNNCSYCIIPHVRGTNRNKELDIAYEEIKHLVARGYQEIVLTGIHTGSYPYLLELIQRMSLLDNLKRIRISSLEITEINEEFLNELKNNEKICNHLHIPLQSGSDAVLKKMNRKYNVLEYKKTINKIRDVRPDINITTDIIVGFPSETEIDFNNTIETAKEIKFGKIHVFPYSKRDGTIAAKIKPVSNEKEKKERVIKLSKLSDNLERNYYLKFLNKELKVLIEEEKTNYSVGHTSNYIKLKIAKKLTQNKEYLVCIDDKDVKMVR